MKLSPITVPYRVVQRASSVVVVAFFAGQSEMAGSVGGSPVVFLLAGAAVLSILAYEVAYYRRFEYELTDDTLDIRSGVVSRRERELPYGRIQNVDITRNAVPRLLGIAAVDFETAGGDRTEGSIRYVTTAEAERLRSEIRDRKRSVGEDEEDAGTGGEEELFAITSRELGLAGALSFDARVVGVLTLVGPGSVPVLSGMLAEPPVAIIAMGAPLLAGLVLAAWLLGIAVAVVNYYGFRLVRSGDELRYERGLFRRYSGSIPASKVQTVTIEDNPLKRAFDYATLTVETAGYSPGSGGGSRGSQVAVPIARRDRVDALAEEIEPFGDLAFRRPPRRIRRRYAVRYLIALCVLAAAGYAADWYLPVNLPWYGVGALLPLIPPAAHLKWKHRGYRAGANHVVTRNGVWNRSTKIVPYYRLQTVIDSRTVFQRRWDVATVVVDTAGSLSLTGRDAAAVDIETADAVALCETLNDRLQDALAERRRTVRPFGPSPPSTSADGGNV